MGEKAWFDEVNSTMGRNVRTSFLWLGISTCLLAACGVEKPEPQAPPPPASTMTPPPAKKVEASNRPDYPETKRDDAKTYSLHNTTISDPYQWLEDVKSPDVQAWMKSQDGYARAHLKQLPERDAIEKRLKELMYHDAIFAPIHRGKLFFYTRRHADREKAIVYWKEGEKGKENVLFDPNTMSKDGSISLHGWFPSWDGKLVAYKLSKNNADAATLHIRDVKTGKDLPKDNIEGAKYAYASWTSDNRGFYYTGLPNDPTIPVSELPGFAEIRYHAVGTESKADVLVHPAIKDPKSFVESSVSRDGTYLFFEVAHGWTSNDVYFRKTYLRAPKASTAKPGTVGEGFQPLVVGKNTKHSVTVWRGNFYVFSNEDAPRGRVFLVNPAKPERKNWKEIIPQNEGTIDSIRIIGDHLAVQYLHNAMSELALYDLKGKLVRKIELPGKGTVSSVTGNPDEDDAYYYFESYVDKPQIQKFSVKKGTHSLWAKIEYPIDTSKLLFEQVFYPSKDGTKISMFVIHRNDLKRTGDNPTLLYGYGGFMVSKTPVFYATFLPWLERGGVVAIPNLRGGGEYGEEWHKSGMLLNKQNVFDDFIAAAEYLQKNKVTNPKKLAIYGGSNGGLLVGATMVQRPDLFQAVVCAVPLLDMLRYHLFGSGKTWIAEYGSAADPKQFAALHAYSPYHHIKQGVNYPALLMLSADSDDRVDPMHARKFVAAAQWASKSQRPIWLRIETNAGHGGGDMVQKSVEQYTDMYAFLFKQLNVK
jgi:prolyl oligopeptidase